MKNYLGKFDVYIKEGPYANYTPIDWVMEYMNRNLICCGVSDMVTKIPEACDHCERLKSLYLLERGDKAEMVCMDCHMDALYPEHPERFFRPKVRE